ncbi:hypothetical protein TW95_gp0670 [Pandoravirus inopinatum]|uniref:Uncharacterized protein n=1 Tax=Pandoravirus inopinatum TaxID=1605721 RepID=A0A0B5J1L4_9VIRU|nr:hypothetical protein TW95_gp0670 [Pandoravirus inopinatum]AJF97404.1 hypothetical protein [Pandoravirus inopinatum]
MHIFLKKYKSLFVPSLFFACARPIVMPTRANTRAPTGFCVLDGWGDMAVAYMARKTGPAPKHGGRLGWSAKKPEPEGKDFGKKKACADVRQTPASSFLFYIGFFPILLCFVG